MEKGNSSRANVCVQHHGPGPGRDRVKSYRLKTNCPHERELHHGPDCRKRLEKCNKELLFEKKMTTELHALRMVLIQGVNVVVFFSSRLPATHTNVCVAGSRLEKWKQNNRKDNTDNETVRDTGVNDGGGSDRA
jgi:hypothetical protein